MVCGSEDVISVRRIVIDGLLRRFSAVGTCGMAMKVRFQPFPLDLERIASLVEHRHIELPGDRKRLGWDRKDPHATQTNHSERGLPWHEHLGEMAGERYLRVA